MFEQKALRPRARLSLATQLAQREHQRDIARLLELTVSKAHCVLLQQRERLRRMSCAQLRMCTLQQLELGVERHYRCRGRRGMLDGVRSSRRDRLGVGRGQVRLSAFCLPSRM